MNYSQLKMIDSSVGLGTTPVVCPVCPVTTDPVSASQLAAAIAGLQTAYAPNADASLIRGVSGSDPVGYTPVFDFNQYNTPASAAEFFLVTPFGYAKAANINNYPALHNQAMSQTLFQLELDGSNSPHHHPDAVEILFVFQGTIEVTRVEPNNGVTYTNTVYSNQTVIFPPGHIHFQHNVGNVIARYISTLNSELPGVMSEAQRICNLPYDVILSMWPGQTAQSVGTMCGNAGTPIPANPIHYITGSYPQKSSSSTGGSSSSSSTGIGDFFQGPSMRAARERLIVEREQQEEELEATSTEE